MIECRRESLESAVVLVFGTRPEAVKLAPVARALLREKEAPPVRLLVTAQHRELLDQMLGVFGLKTHIDLDLMRPGQGLAEFGSRALSGLADVFRREHPAMVLVQGDTSTVLFGALAAFYEKIPVGHVEAGLRSFDLGQPFPEEANRSLTARITSLHFAPTEGARSNLLAEGVDGDKVFVTGNTVVDSLLHMRSFLENSKKARALTPILAPLLNTGRKRILVTIHRRENFGNPLERIFQALVDIAGARPDIDIVYPVHPNPRVHGPAHEKLAGIDNIHLLPPLDYLDFVRLMSSSVLVVTDSGGVQEEAPSFGVPVIVTRETTERPEGIDAGCACLVGSSRRAIFDKTIELLDRERSNFANPYGDGRAGGRIARVVCDYIKAFRSSV